MENSNKNQVAPANNANSPTKDNVVYGVTKSDSVKGSLSWRIMRFKDLDKRIGEYVESPEFAVGDYKWSLFLYPNGSKEDAKSYISIFLSCLNIFHEVTINFTVTFVSQNKASCIDKVLGPIKKTFGADELDWGWSKALDHHSMNLCYLAEDDTLYVRCDVEVFGEWRTTIDHANHEESIPKVVIPECTVSEDFERLLADSPHSDVKFVVGDQHFLAHKGILSVRSAVFRGMFASDMREGREGIVNVEDVDPTIFKEALKFIYVGRCETAMLDERALDLLMVADRYDLGRLKLMCEDILLKKLNINNASVTLGNADMYHAVQLKRNVLEYIVNNFYEVIAAEGFKEWAVENPLLVSEVHDGMAIKMGTKTPDSSSPSSSKSRKSSSHKRRRTNT